MIRTTPAIPRQLQAAGHSGEDLIFKHVSRVTLRCWQDEPSNICIKAQICVRVNPWDYVGDMHPFTRRTSRRRKNATSIELTIVRHYSA